MEGEHRDADVRKISRRQLIGLLGGGITALAADSARTLRAESARCGNHGGAVWSLSPTLHTRLTEEYDVQYPFVGAGMAFVALPPLVAAVSNAGGIGVLGAAPEPALAVRTRIQAMKAMTAQLFGVDFLVDSSPLFGPFTTDDHIDVCIQEGVKLVVFHWNMPPSHWVDRLHAAGAKVWMQVGAVEQALEAARLGTDAIIAQGSQAGGHVKSTTRTIKLLQQIIAAVHPLMVLAAGGIADGQGIVEALANGADGVWVGTRLVASTEAYAHEQYKKRLVQADGKNATAMTTLFGPEWPAQPQRVLRNRVVTEWAGHESEIPTPPPPPPIIGSTILAPGVLNIPYAMPKFSAVVPTPDTVGDLEEMDLPAGEKSVKLIKSIKPAAEIVVEMMEEAQDIITHRCSSAP